MKTLQLHEMENIVGGKFWGTSQTCENTGLDPMGQQTSYVCTDSYIFWIRVDHDCHYASASCATMEVIGW